MKIFDRLPIYGYIPEFFEVEEVFLSGKLCDLHFHIH